MDKHPDTSYNHSHEKSVKSCEKHLTQLRASGQPRSLAASQPRSLAASQLHS
ncbi:hypothetical protein HMPREF9725_01088 [Treponema denticola H1-T]|uniref:Uncharacterized protein n=1 Tax=Treponema denticola H1-T TaxID=999431 RepID=M2C9P5_TREDN|nr:hypothetical protein HMPREF9725_01088 [Treponema denticola H1-T]